MRKYLASALLLSLFQLLIAQDEQLTGLKFNPRLYYLNQKPANVQLINGYLVDKGNTVVATDTLSLPFVDDFSRNRLRSYKWVENHITDTFYNVFGTCLANEGIETIEVSFVKDTAWSYSFDSLKKQIDSTPISPIKFTFFGPAISGCFTQAPQTFYYWAPYYRYHFDSITGLPKDSVMVNDDLPSSGHHIDTTFYAPVVYFAQNEKGTLWFDNYAYINNTYPVNPPTIGVATLDGLDEFGLPYNNVSNTTYGTADYLTSKPIDLSSYDSTSALYLSFFFEAMGLGDCPDKQDSLIVEFRDNSDAWRMVWSDTGYSNSIFAPQKFQQVFIPVRPLPFPYTYYYNTFQFRFRNKASLYGNNDHWHIDYVQLDKNRSDTNTVIHDIAFVYDFPTLLKNYTQLPADHFSDTSDLQSNILLTVHNLDPNADNNPPATNFVKEAVELYPTPVIVANSVLQTFNAGSYSYIQVQPSTEYVIPNTPNWPVDSLVIVSTVTINPNDNRPQNDTLYHTQNFNYVMAYDDGSAENAYGLTGLGLKKFAYEFELKYQDTLSGFQVMFTQKDQNVNDLVFNFYAWDSLRLNDYNFIDSPFFSFQNRKPLYIDSVNGFATYKLDTPLIISGKFYLGWAQTDERRLQVGYDLNSTLGHQHMFIFTNATWKQSTISPEGSPMIRLILDDNFWGTSSATAAIIDLTKDRSNLTIFPNPTSGTVNIRSDRKNTSFDISVVNILGQPVKEEHAVTDRFDISNLPNGMYLLTTKDTMTGKTYHDKIIKTSF